MRSFALTVFSAALLPDSHAFAPSPFLPKTTHRFVESTLYAKSAKKKKPKAAAQSQRGFGKTAVKEPAVDVGDSSAFPPLEESVKSTLVAKEESDDSDGNLSSEIYDRLSQIHGFDRFNYEGLPELSFGDLLNAPSADEAPEPALDFLSALPPFSSIEVLHKDPLVLRVNDFFTPEDCAAYRSVSEDDDKTSLKMGSRTVGKDARAKSQRTSTTWFHNFKDVPMLMARASRLMGLEEWDTWEEPQTVRYRGDEKYTWHLDALSPDLMEGKGGQRTATLLVYLNDLEEEQGGATMFRDLSHGSDDVPHLKVRPVKGSALLFFPSAGGLQTTPFDIRTLHAGEAVSSDSKEDKWIAQMWLRKGKYQPTAPPGNEHDEEALDAMKQYCQSLD